MSTHAPSSLISWETLPVASALILLVVGGIFLLNRADAQARDTTRKHHLEDIEHALYFARTVTGTYPPYDQTSWCGILTAPGNEPILAQVEQALRTQHEKYANPDKPFPTDPLVDQSPSEAHRAKLGQSRHVVDYFYWKHSPASFELYAILEEDPNGERSTLECPTANTPPYDYGIASIWRET